MVKTNRAVLPQSCSDGDNMEKLGLMKLKLTDALTTVKLNAKLHLYMKMVFNRSTIHHGRHKRHDTPTMAGMDGSSAHTITLPVKCTACRQHGSQTSAFIDATLTQSKNNIVALENEVAHQQGCTQNGRIER